MAVINAGFTGVTSPDNWTLAAGASKVDAVTWYDDDTGYINSGATSNTIQTFACSLGLAAGDLITQVYMECLAKRGGGSNAGLVFGYSFTPQGGGTQTGEVTTVNTTTAYQTFTYTHSGLSVLWGSGLTIYVKNTQARDVRVSALGMVITYTPAAASGAQSKVARVRLASRVGGLLAA